jgi:hypothetical protein
MEFDEKYRKELQSELLTKLENEVIKEELTLISKEEGHQNGLTDQKDKEPHTTISTENKSLQDTTNEPNNTQSPVTTSSDTPIVTSTEKQNLGSVEQDIKTTNITEVISNNNTTSSLVEESNHHNTSVKNVVVQQLPNAKIINNNDQLYEIHEDMLNVFNTTEDVTDYPRLFGWGQLHTTLIQTGTPSDSIDMVENPGWTNWLTSRSVLFPFLVKDWVEYVEKMLKMNDFIVTPGRNTVRVIVHTKSRVFRFQWEKIPGYRKIINAFLQMIQQTPRITIPIMDAAITMLHCNPILVNYYNRVILSRTMLYNVSQVLESLLQVQTWFHQYKKMNRPLPPNFDLPYFCSALDAIISSDHHQLIQRVLQLLYDVSDIFTGDLRKNFFSEYLLKKYFFNLFLHWDEVSRNYFHQLLLWKFVRMKSSLVQGNLAEYPFIGKEKDNTFFSYRSGS